MYQQPIETLMQVPVSDRARMIEWRGTAQDILSVPHMAGRNKDLLRRATAALSNTVLRPLIGLGDGEGVCATLGVLASDELATAEAPVREVAPNGREVPVWRELTADKKAIMCGSCVINTDCSLVFRARRKP